MVGKSVFVKKVHDQECSCHEEDGTGELSVEELWGEGRRRMGKEMLAVLW